jgi:isopenicillin N synthase-like dioxygenase
MVDNHESIDWGTKHTSYATAMDGKKHDDLNNWPSGHPEFQKACETYFDDIVALGRRLLHLFALSLDLDEMFFDEYTKGPACIARVVHYPPQDPTTIDASQIGIGAHTVPFHPPPSPTSSFPLSLLTGGCRIGRCLRFSHKMKFLRYKS